MGSALDDLRKTKFNFHDPKDKLVSINEDDNNDESCIE